jgi:hypothetical protein
LEVRGVSWSADLNKGLDAAKIAQKTRFIPIELWTGSNWDGEHKLNYGFADLTFGNGRKRITGPIEWRDPITGSVVIGYRRVHLKYGKVQIFTVTHNGQSLGRVYDSRHKASISDGAKFPLGLWKQGEKRIFDSIYTRVGRKQYIRRRTMEIIRINFSFNDNKNCLKFRWKTEDRKKGRIIDDNNYTYCPGKGLVEIEDN